MSRPPRESKVNALNALEMNKEPENYKCPPPLRERLGIGQGNLPSTSSSSCVPPSSGRGLLLFKNRHCLPGGDQPVHKESLPPAPALRVRHKN
jgi:hypothetical protein